MQFRVGTGFDVHALVENRDLILAGVRVPYERGLLGHSDADVMPCWGQRAKGISGNIFLIRMINMKARTAGVFCALLWNCCRKTDGGSIMWM